MELVHSIFPKVGPVSTATIIASMSRVPRSKPYQVTLVYGMEGGCKFRKPATSGPAPLATNLACLYIYHTPQPSSRRGLMQVLYHILSTMEGEWVGGMTGEDWDAVAEIGAASPAGAFSPRFPESSAFPAVGMPATTTPATSALRRSAEAGSVAGARLAVQQPLRKSCEFCRFRKKKCDGDGVNKCR